MAAASSSIDESWSNSAWCASAWDDDSVVLGNSAEVAEELSSVDVPTSSVDHFSQSWSSHQATWGTSFIVVL